MAFTVLLLLYLLVHVNTYLLSISFVPGHMLILGERISGLSVTESKFCSPPDGLMSQR